MVFLIRMIYGLTDEQKQLIDKNHKQKIIMSDEVYVVNKNKYIGESTKSEIEFAISIGKPVIYMEN